MSEEKNFEGKVLSPSSNKTRKRSPKNKTKICQTCGQDILQNEIRKMYMYKDTYHQLRTKEYCDVHEAAYSHHKCKPNWCGDCDYLINYQIEIQEEK